MIWEYLILAALLAWAIFYLWRTFFRKGGCACGSCPSAKSQGCPTQGTSAMCTLADAAEDDAIDGTPCAGGSQPPGSNGKNTQ